MYPTVTFDKTWESALSRVACHQSHLFRLYEEKMTPAKYPLATWSSSLIPRQIISEIRYRIQRTTTPQRILQTVGLFKARVRSDESIKLFTVESRFPPFYNKGKIFNGNSRDFMILIIGRPSSQHFSSKNIQWELWWFYEIDSPSPQLSSEIN